MIYEHRTFLLRYIEYNSQLDKELDRLSEEYNWTPISIWREKQGPQDWYYVVCQRPKVPPQEKEEG